MSSEPLPFLPEPEPVTPPTPPKKSGRKTLVLWVILIMMFLAIWQFLAPEPGTGKPPAPVAPPCEPASWWVTTAPWLAIAVCLFFAVRWFLRAYGQSLEFNVAQEPGRVAVAERRFGAAFDVFARNVVAYAKKPPYVASANLALGHAQLWAGEIPRAIETFAGIEKKRAVLFSSSVRTIAAVNLAFAQALAGQPDAAERWCAETRARLAKNRDDRLEYAARLCLAEATIALRRGRGVDAAALLEKNWVTMREVLNANMMRVAEVLRAFAEAAGGVRQSNTIPERLVRVEPVLPGEFAFLGLQWPEMQTFLAAHGLGARSAE
jgi:hypothetical protein